MWWIRDVATQVGGAGGGNAEWWTEVAFSTVERLGNGPGIESPSEQPSVKCLTLHLWRRGAQLEQCAAS
jgi:hypothetical protein